MKWIRKMTIELFHIRLVSDYEIYSLAIGKWWSSLFACAHTVCESMRRPYRSGSVGVGLRSWQWWWWRRRLRRIHDDRLCANGVRMETMMMHEPNIEMHMQMHFFVVEISGLIFDFDTELISNYNHIYINNFFCICCLVTTEKKIWPKIVPSMATTNF